MKKALRWLASVVLVAAILYMAAQVELTHKAYFNMAQAPQGQSVGPARAPVTIVEFMDYRCEACHALYPVMEEVTRRHPEVRIVYRHLPIYKEQSITEARLALAAGKQGRFKEMHDLLMSRDKPVADGEIADLARQAGVDYGRLKTDMMGRDITIELKKNEMAEGLLGIKGDPSFLIGETLYTPTQGMPTADDFDRLIRQAEAEKGNS